MAENIGASFAGEEGHKTVLKDLEMYADLSPNIRKNIETIRKLDKKFREFVVEAADRLKAAGDALKKEKAPGCIRAELMAMRAIHEIRNTNQASVSELTWRIEGVKAEILSLLPEAEAKNAFKGTPAPQQ